MSGKCRMAIKILASLQWEPEAEVDARVSCNYEAQCDKE